MCCMEIRVLHQYMKRNAVHLFIRLALRSLERPEPADDAKARCVLGGARDLLAGRGRGARSLRSVLILAGRGSCLRHTS